MELLQNFNETIAGYKLLAIYRAYPPAHNYLFTNKQLPSINHNVPFLNSREYFLKNKERKILDLLEENPRYSFNEIAIKINSSIQVCKEMGDIDTRDREINGLIDAMKSHKLKEGLILTYNESESLEIDGYNITVKPIWKWLLE